MGIIKSNTDLRSLRQAAQAAGEICDELLDAARPGVSTLGLEAMAIKLLARHRSSTPFKTFTANGQSFAHAICVSLDDEIINGPPSRERIIKDDQLVKIAIGTEIRGMHGKAARTGFTGIPSEEIKRLIEGTKACFDKALAISPDCKTLNELLEVIPQSAAEYKLSLVENLGGAGIGKKLHEYPAVPNDPIRDLHEQIPLEPGLAFTMMPIFKLGEPGFFLEHPDGWTYLTEDGQLASHIADTMLITQDGLEILSR